MSEIKPDLNFKVWTGYKHQLSNIFKSIRRLDKFHSLCTRDRRFMPTVWTASTYPGKG